MLEAHEKLVFAEMKFVRKVWIFFTFPLSERFLEVPLLNQNKTLEPQSHENGFFSCVELIALEKVFKPRAQSGQ